MRNRTFYIICEKGKQFDQLGVGYIPPTLIWSLNLP